jgi:hypothetical protein
VKDYIRPKGLPWEYAQKAYDSGHHIEAIQILHVWIENKLQELLILVGSVKFGAKHKDTWDIANEIPFIHTLRALFVLGQLNSGEYRDLLELNSARNKIIHKLFRDPYEEIYPGFSKKEFDVVFKKSIRELGLIEEKIQTLVFRP